MAPRRTEALSRERIVEAAVGLLDRAGEGGLTFRALAERLATGPGAIYHHVANREELLAAATDAVVATALAPGPASGASTPPDAVRAVALGLFDAIDEHPWLAAQLATAISRRPGGPTTPRIFEGFGRPVRALGVPEASWFTATSALVHYVLGAVGPNAHVEGIDMDRRAFLDVAATAWEELDPDAYPVTRTVAGQLREHDDREQFLAGVTVVLAGITATHAPGAR